MIDWNASAISIDNVRNKDKIIVICEKCNRPRSQLYAVAKRKSQHICMSCTKKVSKYVTNDIVEYVCVDCGKKKLQKYRPDRFNNWRCHHCAMVNGHKEGKFTIVSNKPSKAGREKLSILAKERWKNPEYRKKWKESSSRTKESRSKRSKELWADTDRLARLSESLKRAWGNQDYRTTKTKQSRELWRDPEYIVKQLTGMTMPNVSKTISMAALNNWARNREKLVTIIRNNLARTDVIDKISVASKRTWQNTAYRELQSAKNARVFADESIIDRIRQQSIAQWADPVYREMMISKIREFTSTDSYRELMRGISRDRWTDSEYCEKMALVRAAQSNRQSNIETMLYNTLDTFGIQYNKQTAIGFYTFDCLIPRQVGGLLIECQGDYWHSLERVQYRDRSKFTYISRYFPEYEIMYVWEHEFYTKDRVLDRLKLKLGIEVQTTDFDFCDVTIGVVPNDKLRSFLDSYHYIGAGRWGTVFGAYYDDELIAVVVFSSPLRQNVARQFGGGKVIELSRLCIHPSYHKKNFASWLISKVLKRIDADVVVAYADTTVGHNGIIYLASNFKLHHEVEPDYWYVDNGGYVMHKKTLYSRAVKMKMRESEFAENNGYIKKYGGPKKCFIKIIGENYAGNRSKNQSWF